MKLDKQNIDSSEDENIHNFFVHLKMYLNMYVHNSPKAQSKQFICRSDCQLSLPF